MKKILVAGLILLASSSLYDLHAADFKIIYNYNGQSLNMVDTTNLNEGIYFIHSYLYKVFGLKKLSKVDTVKINFIDDVDELRKLSNPNRKLVGLYTNKECYIWTGAKRYKNTVFHEVTHLFLDFYSGYHPPWLNEGLAEYFEELALKEGEYYVLYPKRGNTNFDKCDLKKYFRNVGKNLGAELHHYPNLATRNIYRSLIYFLMDEHQIFLQDLLLYRKYSPHNTDASYHLIDMLYEIKVRASGANFRKFESDWKDWAKKDVDVHQLKLAPLPDDKGINKFLRKMTRSLG